jgi:hypothetical protein
MALGSADIGLLFKISADGRQATTEMQQLRKSYDSELKGIRGGFKDFAVGVGQDLGLTEKQMAQLAAGLPIVGAGIAAVAGIATGAAVGLFKLVESTAEAGSRIHDLSQQTGIGALALSGLGVAADQSGSNLEALAAPLGKYNKLLGDAANESKNAIAVLAKYGLTAQQAEQDSTAALAKIIAHIHNLENDTQRVTAAQEVFGAKMGAKLVPVIEQMNGSLDGAIQKARELGVAFTDEAAARADEFGDRLADLTKKLTGVGYVIGNELLPLALNAMDQISGKLGTNVEDFQTWAVGIRGAVASVIASLVALAKADLKQPSDTETILGSIFPPLGGGFALKHAGEFGADFKKTWREEMEALMSDVAVPPAARRTDGADASAGGGRGRRGGDTSQKELQALLKSLDAEIKATDNAYKEEVDSAKRAYDKRLEDLRTYTAEVVDAEGRRMDEVRILLNREIVDAEQHGKDKGAKAAQLRERLAEEERKSQETINRLRDEQDKKEEAARRAHAQALVDIEDAKGEAEIARVNAQADRRFITEEEAEQKIGQLHYDALARRRDLLQADLVAAGANVEERQKITDALAQLEVQIATSVEETERRVSAARRRHYEAELQFARDLHKLAQQVATDQLELDREKVLLDSRRIILAGGTAKALERIDLEAEAKRHKIALEELDDLQSEQEKRAETLDEWLEVERIFHAQREQEEQRHQQREQEIKEEAGDTEDEGLFSGIKKELNDIPDLTPKQFSTDALTKSFVALKSAILQSLDAYILYGKGAKQVFQQVFAELAATLAKEAAIQALKQEALALSALAIGDFGGFAKHQLAAGAWLALTLGLAKVGRSIAGDAFTGGSGAGASGTGSGATSGTGSTTQQERAIQVTRPAYTPSPVRVDLRLEHVHTYKGQIDGVHVEKMVTETIVKDVRGGGKIREIIRRVPFDESWG